MPVRRGTGWRWVAAAVLVAAGIGAPASVSAQSQVCRQLQTDYARLQARIEAADPVGDAFARQQAALARRPERS